MEQFSLEPRLVPSCAAAPLCGVQDACICNSLMDHLSRETDGDDIGMAQVLARRDSAQVVEGARTDLQDRVAALIRSKATASARLSELARFLRTQQIRVAVELAEEGEQRYGADGAHDRRRRFPWPRWLPANLVVLAVTIFDTWFLGTVFATVFDIDTSTTQGLIQLPLAYLPGVILATALIVAGVWLGESVMRWREVRRGWVNPESSPTVDWVLPGIFGAAVFLTVVLIASSRESFVSAAAADQAVLDGTSTDAAYISSAGLIGLFTMLTVLAVVVKIADSNVHADSRDEDVDRRTRAEQALQATLGPARAAVEAYELRWSELWEGLAYVVSGVNDVWSNEEWFRRYLGPQGAADKPGIDDRGSAPEADEMAALMRNLPDPPPVFGPVLHGWRALASNPWPESVRRLEELQLEAENQATHPAFREV